MAGAGQIARGSRWNLPNVSSINRSSSPDPQEQDMDHQNGLSRRDARSTIDRLIRDCATHRRRWDATIAIVAAMSPETRSALVALLIAQVQVDQLEAAIMHPDARPTAPPTRQPSLCEAVVEVLRAKNNAPLSTREIHAAITRTAPSARKASVSATVSAMHHLARTAGRFPANEILADAAYLSKPIAQRIADAGAVPYIDFRSNSTGARGPAAYRAMYHHFRGDHESYARHYHQRSNVETVFHMVKQKYSPKLSAKKRLAQFAEVLLKFLCHNVSCLVQAIHKFGIVPRFATMFGVDPTSVESAAPTDGDVGDGNDNADDPTRDGGSR
jgi:hypothetical protein